jgi:hypothetical protein
MDFIREVAIGIFLSWHIKGRPFLTSLLKGYYIGFVILTLLTLVRLFRSERILETIKRDVMIFFILGTVISSLLLIFTFINKYFYSSEK